VSSDELLSRLNRQQRKAVEHVQGPLLILAGAGSGKTRTITYRIAYLIREGHAFPENILAVTFTNKAADEMRNRVEQLTGQWSRPPLICTFHSFGVRVLRRYAGLIGYRPDFAICDVDDQKRLLRRIYRIRNLRNDALPLEKTRAMISKAKNRKWDPEAFLNQSKSMDAEAIYEVYRDYQKLLKTSNSMDFDDLILLPVRLLEENPELQEAYGRQYTFLLIDEYQDTNPPQYDLIRLLTGPNKNVCAVGDEDQSIYRFRGADIYNILRFEKDYPGTKLIKLEQNYRSTQNILSAATAVISNNTQRKEKVLWTDSEAGEPLTIYVAEDARGEAEFVARTAFQHQQNGIERQAVLYRTNFQSRQFEEAFTRYQMEYRLVGGLSFYQRKEVKDAISYLRVAVNPNDDAALTRILNEPPRGIGRKTRTELFKLAAELGCSPWEALQHALSHHLFSSRSRLCLERFHKLFLRLREALSLPLHIALEKILDVSGYIDALRKEESEDSSNRILNLQELITVAKEYEEREESLQQFLDHVALRAETDDYEASAPITLMTLHNAKGLEFPVVYLVGCEDGLFPHSRAIAENDLEEERRLCYVGMTRAEKRLYLSYSRRRRFFGREGNELSSPSRFLTEIPLKLVGYLEAAPRYHQRGLQFQASAPQKAGEPQAFNKSGRNFQGKSYNTPDSVKDLLKRRAGKSQKGFAKDSTVIHERFGRGRVLQVEYTGSDLKVTVQFPGIGIKKLLQSYARLKKA